MYAYIKGIIDEINQDSLVIEAGGVGYLLIVSANTAQRFTKGNEAKIYVYQAVREDAITLYGFVNLDEKRMFLRLITVSGIGPKLAIQILSSISPQDLALALVTGDAAALTKVPGIGKKTAQRLILELKEKVDNEELIPGASDGMQTQNVSGVVFEAVHALMALGYPSAEATKAVNAVAGLANSVEDIIRLVLKSMDRR